MKKFKILMLADNPLNTSGVGCQARHLIEGMLKKDRWKFLCFGGAIRHEDYTVQMVDGNPDFVVKPVDGFGTPEMLRQVLVQEKPDALFLFTDPRFFLWAFEIEDDIHQICPIVYWHVWDNDPWPEFNRVLYESTDLINCHSYLTYGMVHERFPEKTNFIPHALPDEVFKPLPTDLCVTKRRELIGPERDDHFICIWVNRNARRKMPGNVMLAWKLFLDKLEATHGHRKATLLMHTNPYDQEGQNLPNIAEAFGLTDSVIYSAGRISFDEMAVLYNISDVCINQSSHEGFGLSTLEAMQCGKPIIALKTGGLTRQVVDHRDGSQNGIALDPDVRDLVGGQMVPYIYEDHVAPQKVADAIWQLYDMPVEDRKKLGLKARDYVLSEFALQKTIDDWDETLYDTISRWKSDKASMYTPWTVKAL